MTAKERVNRILRREAAPGESAFWGGKPHPESEAALYKALGVKDYAEYAAVMGDDMRWFTADSCYKHPEGRPMFENYPLDDRPLSHGGAFENCEDVEQVETYTWPDPAYLDFTDLIAQIDAVQEQAVFVGMWSPFFHIVCDYMGMENYFIKMYTNPDVVMALTNKIVDFYVAANEKLFEQLGERGDCFFFGNDFGTQLDLLVSPDCFDTFLLPSIKRLIAVGKKYNKKVAMHSCGSIYRIIPKLIEAGLDALHPLQAQAVGMDAENLARFQGQIAFMGGIDMQGLLTFGTPAEIEAEVQRVARLLGPNWIAGPSHECILPNVPLENLQALSRAARALSGR